MAWSDLARDAFKQLLFTKPWKQRRRRKKEREKVINFSLAVASGNVVKRLVVVASGNIN